MKKSRIKLGSLIAGIALIILGIFLSKIILIAGAGFLILAAVLHFKKTEWEKEVENNLDGMGIQKQYFEPRPFKYVTTLGAIIESVAEVPPQALEAIDRGFQRQIDRFEIMFSRAGFPSWNDSVRGTKVFLISPNRLMGVGGDTTVFPVCSLESIPGAPCFYANGIKTAGTVLGMDDYWDAIDLDPIIVLPHQGPTWEWLDYLAAAAHNEREHYAGWKGRRKEPTGFFYNFIGANDQHPQQWDINNPVPYLTDGFASAIDASDLPHNCFPK
jgi:hypothetical protein